MRTCTGIVLLVAIWIGISAANKAGAFGFFYLISEAGKKLGDPSMVGLTPMFMKEDLSKAFTFADVGRLDGKVALVTGANVGLGFETAKNLAKQGADVVVACRSEKKCNLAVEDMKAKLKGKHGKIVPMITDLADLASVNKFCSEFLKAFDRLDIFVMNAGLAFVPDLTKDGIDRKFQVNHLGHFLMYQKLEKLIKDTAKKAPVQIVAVSSAAHYSPIPGVGVYTDLESINKNEHSEFENYGATKLCNVLFMNELAQRTKDLQIYPNSAAPGVTYTNILEPLLNRVGDYGKGHAYLEPVMKQVVRALDYLQQTILWSTEDGARAQFYAAASPEIVKNNIRGRFFQPVNEDTPYSKFATPELGAKLWDFSVKLLQEKGFLN